MLLLVGFCYEDSVSCTLDLREGVKLNFLRDYSLIDDLPLPLGNFRNFLSLFAENVGLKAQNKIFGKYSNLGPPLM